MSDTTTAPVRVHPFEKAGLGIAPFRCVGFEVRKYQACQGAPIQPGAACDYCGTGISDCFSIKSADGRTFIVGSDCVAKCNRAAAGTDAEKTARKLHEDVLRVKRVATHAKQDTKIAEIVARVEANRAALAAVPHPLTWRAARGETLLDSIEWTLKNAGRAGKLRLGKLLDTVLT